MEGRKCLDHQSLFSSEYLSVFNFKDFYYSHPEATKQEARAARVQHEAQSARVIAKAKSICESCPFVSECREWALTCMEEGIPLYGVTGGLTQEEQQEIINERRN